MPDDKRRDSSATVNNCTSRSDNNYPTRLQLAFVSHLLLLLCATALAAQGVYFSRTLPPGANYTIYKYISSYQLRAGNYPSKQDGVDHPVSPDFRDYTPFNSVVYKAVFSTGAKFSQGVFFLWQLGMLLMGLFLVRKCSGSFLYYLSIIYFTSNPLCARWLLGDDKAGFLLGPILPIAANAAGWPAACTAITVGFYGGWTGLGLSSMAAMPALAGRRLNTLVWLSCLAFAVVLTLACVDGIAGLESITNRLNREELAPFWYTIWRLFPAAAMDFGRTPVVAGFLALIATQCWRGRIAFQQAIILSSCAYLLFSNNTVPNRIFFFAPLLATLFRTRWAQASYLCGTSAAVFATHMLTKAMPSMPGADATNSLGLFGTVVLCNAPLVVPMFGYFKDSLRVRGSI